MTIRLRTLQEILAAGWNLLFTDVDAVFLTDPFKYYQQGPYDLELCSDAPYVAQDYQNSPMMVMAGYFYARGGRRTSGFLREVLELQERQPDIHDQQVFNSV